MAEFDVTYVIERKVRIVAPTVEHAKLQAEALVRASMPAKLMSIIPHPYVEPPSAPEHKPERRDCQCPDCAGAQAWAESPHNPDNLEKAEEPEDALPVPK